MNHFLKKRGGGMKTKRLFFFSLLAIALIIAVGTPTKSQFIQANGDEEDLIAGRNVNMLSGHDPITVEPYDKNGQRQNEPSIAVSTRNPLHLIAGANDWQPLDMDIPGEELPGVQQGIAVADAWMGIFTSTDGGESWKNQLLPGSLVDDDPYNPHTGEISPIYGYEAAADPVWRAGAAGMFFGTGITFNRGQRGLGALFVARYIDRNNREGGDPIQYIDTKVIDIGNAGHFIDKCWLVVDVPRETEVATMSTVTLPNGDVIPRMNVFVVYTSFLGDTEEDVHGKLMISVSHDSGETWTSPSQITDAGKPYQAATLAIDPRNGRLHIAWRRFAKDEHTDAIMMLSQKTPKDLEEGYTHEKLKFTKPVVVQEIVPFDQPTAETMFRTNTYPSMTVDHNGIVYLAYAMRDEFDYSRIYITMWDPDNDLWYGPTEICLIDNLPENPPGVRLSHMFMPAICYGAGKITLVWYDQRWDISGVYSYYINDAYPLQWRHTIDVRAAQSDPFPDLDFSTSIQVSKYPWLLLEDVNGIPTGAIQLKHFFPGLEIFQQGTRGFIGDYIDLSPSPPFIPDGEGGWSYNTGIQSTGIQETTIQTETGANPVFHIAWADNRDVSGDLTGFNPPGNPEDPETPCLNPDQTNSRNQNVYTSRLTRGIIAGSPGNTKPLNIKRAFVVFVKNTTQYDKYVDLTITSHDGATAKFAERGVEYDDLSEVYIPPYSTTSRTVSVDVNAGLHASVTINVFDFFTQTLLAQVTLNPDPTTPPYLEDPDGNEIDVDTETHTPHVGAYHVIEWNYDLANPHVGAPHVGAWAPSANDDWVTPHVGAPHVGAPHVGAPHVGAPHVGAVNIIAPHVGATHLYDDIPDDSSMTDVYVGVENVGNTTSSYSISTLPVEVPEGILVQLLVYRVHVTPSADGCDPIFEEHHELISSITPHVGATPPGTGEENPLTAIQYIDLPVDVNVPVEAGGKIVLCYRILDPDKYDDIKVEPTSFVPVVQQDVKDIIDGTPQVYDPPPALAVTTTSLSNGFVGVTYSQTLTADGGHSPYTWDLEVAPIWMSIDPNTGEIYGTPSIADIGTNIQVTVSVTDTPPSGITQQTSYKTFYIGVYEASQVELTGPASVYTGTLTGAFTLTSQDYLDNPTDVTANIVFNLTSSSSGNATFYSDAGGTEEITQVTIGTGTNSATFYYRDTAAGYPEVFASWASGEPDLGSDSHVIQVITLPPGPDITTTWIQDGVKDEIFGSTNIEVSGGVPPLTWALASGSDPLPDGLTLNPSTGVLSGTPLESGYFGLTIEATDSLYRTDTQDLNLSIAEWISTYNGSPPNDGVDQPIGLAVDIEDNIYVTGKSWGGGSVWNWDYLTIKYDSAGNEIWPAPVRYDVSGSYEIVHDIVVDVFGNPYVTGDSNANYRTIKFNSADGAELLNVTYDGPAIYDRAFALAVDALGNIYVTGKSNGVTSMEDYCTVKYDSNGNQKWVARYNGPGNDIDEPLDIAVDPSGNVYVTGWSIGSTSGYDYCTVKYDGGGNELWVARHDGGTNNRDSANAIAVDTSGNVYVTGYAWGAAGGIDYCTIKYNSAGVEQWVRNHHGSGDHNDYAFALAVDSAGNVYVTGESYEGFATGSDFATIKYNSAGTLQWIALFNSFDDNRDQANDITLDPFGNVYVTGRSTTDSGNAYLSTVAYDNSGNELWRAKHQGAAPGVGDDWNDFGAKAIGVDSLGNVYVTGRGLGTGNGDYATIKYTQSLPSTLVIGTNVLDDGIQGQSYAAAVHAFGGSVPRTWSIISGNLPSGVDLSAPTGRIVGTPQTPGTYSFTIQVTDGVLTATKALSITIESEIYDFIAKFGEYGSGSGQFIMPQGVACDGAGYIYVVDSGNNRIQKFTPSGVFDSEWTTTNYPYGIAIDSGYVYISEKYPGLIEKYTTGGSLVDSWGTGELFIPQGMAIDNGYLYVADWGSDCVVKYTTDGTYVTQWGTTGSGNGEFADPFDVAVDSSGNVYVSDEDNERVQKFNSSGVYQTQWPTDIYTWMEPQGIAADSADFIYVVTHYEVQKFLSDGTHRTEWGSAGDGDGQLSSARALFIDDAGFVYVADTQNSRIQIFQKR
jgi:hypothetical protein